jgi:hypothetical protein
METTLEVTEKKQEIRLTTYLRFFEAIYSAKFLCTVHLNLFS